MKKHVCKRCKAFFDSPQCPNCKVSEFASGWQGRINVLDVQKSTISKKVGVEVKGEYALKVR